MKYKTNWLAGLIGPMLVGFGVTAGAVPSTMVTTNSTTLFIDRGAVYGMGGNQYRAIQDGTVEEFRTPFFTGKLNAISLALAMQRRVVLYANGTADYAGLNFNTWAMSTVTSIPATGITDVALTTRTVYYVTNSQLYGWAGNSVTDVPYAVPGGSNVSQIAAGNDHLMVLFKDGTVGTLGLNAYGQLGNGTTTASTVLTIVPGLTATSIAAMYNSSYAMQADGTVKAFGQNTQYQLGLGTNLNQLTPITIPGLTGVAKINSTGSATIALKSDGTVMGCGWHNYIEGALYNTNQTCVPLPLGNGNRNISQGAGRQMLDRGTEGQRVGWYGNLYGSLGDGTNTERHQVVSAYFAPVVPPPVIVVPPPVIVVPPPVIVVPPPVVTDPKCEALKTNSPFTKIDIVLASKCKIPLYTSMNACIKANPRVVGIGQLCKNLIIPADRGQQEKAPKKS